ncbi:MAG TPA: hypothetical protein VGL61_03650 [Kofleriaceae bacterium]
MKWLVVIMCAACGGQMAAPPDASTSFTFMADYTLDSTITSAIVGSASYATGQTVHFELTYPSYGAAQGSATTMTVTAGSATGSVTITPACPDACGDSLTIVSYSATVSWQGGPIVTVEGGYCSAPGSSGSGCGFAD